MREMFKGLFGRKSSEKDENSSKIEESTNDSPEIQHRGEGFTREQIIQSISVHKSGHRTIMTIPKNLFNLDFPQMRRLLTRELYPKITDGSYPVWGEESKDAYMIEIFEKYVEPFKEEIVNWVLNHK